MNYSQRDPQWAGQRLGTCDGVTIGSDGCYVTAFANIASHFGKDINPAQLDDDFTNNGRYVSGCLCRDNMLTEVYPDIRYVETFHFEDRPADFSVIVNSFEDEYVIELDANPSAPGVQTHFNRFFDYYNGVLRIIDSWTGQLINVADVYGDPAVAVQKIVHYIGPTPTPQTPPPAIPVVDPAPVLPDPHVIEQPPAPDPVPEPTPPTNEDTNVPEVIAPPVQPAQPTVKPGIKTTEFWTNLIVQLTAILTVATTAVQTPGSVWVKAVAVIAAVLASLGYTNGRSKVKVAAYSASRRA